MEKLNNLDKYLETLNWCSQSIENQCRSKISTYGILIQTNAHHRNVLKYFSLQNGFFQQNTSYDLISKIIKKPVRVHSRITPNSAQFMSSWILSCSSEPEEFAKTVVNYFIDNPTHLNFFAAVTFPAIYHHFLSYEFIKLAFDFLENLFRIATPQMFSLFFASFFLNSQKFIYNLWTTYQDKEIKYQPETASDFMSIFFDALSTSSVSLTHFHIKLIDMFYEKEPEVMAATMVQQVFISSFLDYFNSIKGIDETHNIITLLIYAATKPTTAHFSLIVDALHPSFFAQPIYHDSLSYSPRTPFVLSCHECYLIQNIILTSEKLKKIKIIPSLLLKNKLENDFEPLFLELSVKKQHGLVDIPPENIIFENLQKIKPKGKPEFIRCWNMVCQQISDPLSIFTAKDTSPKLRDLLQKVTMLKDPDFVTYAKCCMYDEAVQSQHNFEEIVNLLDSGRILEDEQFFFNANFETQLAVTWQGVFSNSNLIGPILQVSQQKKRRNSYSAPKQKKYDECDINYIPNPPEKVLFYEQPVQRPQNTGFENERIVQVIPSLIQHKTDIEASPGEKMHILLTKCVLPIAREWIFAKCFDEYEGEPIPELDDLKNKFSYSLKEIAFKFEFDEDPFTSIVKYYSQVDNDFYYEKLNLVKYKLDEIQSKLLQLPTYKPGSCSIEIIRIANIIDKILSTRVIKKNAREYLQFCAGVISAMIVESQNSEVINSFFICQRIWNNYGELRSLTSGIGYQPIQFFESAVWSLLKDTSQDLTEIAIKLSSNKIF